MSTWEIAAATIGSTIFRSNESKFDQSQKREREKETERRADAESSASLWCHPLEAALYADDTASSGGAPPLALNKAAAALRA
ncbi:hypothetical protein OUZ56_005150 [Daphnia magna]|uniref:Uncharacterized protein n=1 Tax=Daphnia magna TaxID=35525 RepID=A0ABQ9YRZ0_9CRUS|nr:hypothetical protein OUZ56_005150 [Daphnia magna]